MEAVIWKQTKDKISPLFNFVSPYFFVSSALSFVSSKQIRKTKMTVGWVVVPCSLADVYRRFRGFCCLHHQGDWSPLVEAVSISETSVYLFHTAWRNSPKDSHPQSRRRQNLTSERFEGCWSYHMFSGTR
jgi:hypothetical protein